MPGSCKECGGLGYIIEEDRSRCRCGFCLGESRLEWQSYLNNKTNEVIRKGMAAMTQAEMRKEIISVLFRYLGEEFDPQSFYFEMNSGNDGSGTTVVITTRWIEKS